MVATSLNNLALIYFDQGKYDQAELLYQKSLGILEKALGNDPTVAANLNNLAVLYKTQGQYTKAESLFQRSLSIKIKVLGKDSPDVARSKFNLARLFEAEGIYEKAEQQFHESLMIKNQALDHWLWGAGEKTRQAYLQKEEGARNVYLSFYSQHYTPEEALYFSLSRKGLLLRISSEVSALTRQNPDPAIQQQVDAFKALRTQLSTLVFSGKADPDRIKALEEQSNTLERELSSQLSAFKHSSADVTPEQVLAKLSPEQSLVDFLVFTEVDFKTQKHKTEQLIALVANPQNGVQLIKLGEFAPIAQALKSYLEAIDNMQPTNTLAQRLYQQLWKPLLPYLQQSKTVYLVPDGQLHLLPFKALQDSDGNYLGAQQQLITLSSARELVLPHIAGSSTQATILADPDFGNPKPQTKTKSRGISLSDIYFAEIPATLKEGQAIDTLYKQQTHSPSALYLKKQATEQTIAAANSPKILHLATHGFFLEDLKPDPKSLERGLMLNSETNHLPVAIDNPLARSGLALAGANLSLQGLKRLNQADSSDGILTALDVLNLNLQGTDLVTLSACQTGVGDVKVGEGVYSLNRAFQEAGAKAVLSTLWNVADDATGLFMQKFYTRYLQGSPAQQALQDTQTEFMQDKKYSHPLFWAGFVMTGKD